MANQALILLGGTFGGVALILIFLVFRYCFDSIFSKIVGRRRVNGKTRGKNAKLFHSSTKMAYVRGQEVFRDSKPFSYVVKAKYSKIVCDGCLHMSKNEGELSRCTKCRAVYYCNRKCQLEAWKSHHKLECYYLQRMPFMFKMFQDIGSQMISVEGSDLFGAASEKSKDEIKNYVKEEVLKLLRIILKLSEKGKEEFFVLPNGKKRHYKDLVSNVEELKRKYDEKNMNRLRFYHEQYQAWLGSRAPSSFDEFFDIFGKSDTNEVHISIGDKTLEGLIATGLYLGYSAIDHSCDPNAEFAFNGKEVIVKALGKVKDFSDIRFSYLPSLKGSKAERKKRLQDGFHFDCNCLRCERE